MVNMTIESINVGKTELEIGLYDVDRDVNGMTASSKLLTSTPKPSDFKALSGIGNWHSKADQCDPLLDSSCVKCRVSEWKIPSLKQQKPN
jgi:hypothetical protein